MIWLKVFGFLLLALPVLGLEICRLDYGSFGAIPDDGQDDSRALQKALDHLVAQGGGTLQIPSGVYEFHSRVTVEGSFDFLRIEGAGQSLSRLVGLNDEGILKIVSQNAHTVIEIVDLDLPPGKTNCGTALELIKPYSEPQDRDYNLLLNNLELKPMDMNTCYFTRVFVADGWMPLLDNINTSGLYGPKFNTFEGKRRKYEAKSIVTLTKAYKPRIQYCNLWAAEYGIIIELTDAHEQPTINTTVSVENAHGIQITKTGNRLLSNPVLIDGCHWNNSFYGLVMKDVDSFRLVQNCLYGASDVEDSYQDIRLINCSNGELVDNSFWFAVKPRTCVFVDKASRNIRIHNTHFGRGVSLEPVILEAGAQNITVENNVYGTVYALDEKDTFGLWEMEEMAGGKALDKDRLCPERNNDLRLTRAVPVAGAASLKLGQAISFRDPTAEASPVQEWDGAPGVRIQFHVQISAGFDQGKSTIMEVLNVYKVNLDAGQLCFTFYDEAGKEIVLSAGRIPAGKWFAVLAEVDPKLERAVLEVSGIGGDRRFIDQLELNSKKRPLTLSPNKGGKKFTGAIDQLWIKKLHK
jgi:hypothetical protein